MVLVVDIYALFSQGKFYMGREISHVMGHQGAGWLDRPERIREERTDLAIVLALIL